MIPQTLKDEALMLARSFIGAVLAGAAMAAVNFFIAHVPQIINFLVTLGGGYIGVKTTT